MKKILILNFAAFLMMASPEASARFCDENDECASNCCIEGRCHEHRWCDLDSDGWVIFNGIPYDRRYYERRHEHWEQGRHEHWEQGRHERHENAGHHRH